MSSALLGTTVGAAVAGEHGDTLHVLDLVAGTAAESQRDTFAPFQVHHAETFVIPATLGRARLRSLAPPGVACTVMRARGRPTDQ